MNRFYIGLKSVCFQIIFFLLFPIFIIAQETDTSSVITDEVKAYTAQAEQLIKFLEYTFNTLGDPEVPARDKDIIINQSYLKFFLNGNVQIEDDLDENRFVVTNKDIQAYLKDINFFFKTVVFQFDIEEVSHEINEKSEVYFKVTLNRNLKGITIDGDSVNNNQPRFIEINLDERNQDMKIASIYTTRLNEDEEIANWWLNLSPTWRSFFLENIIQEDSLNIGNVVAFGDSLVVISLTDSIPKTLDSSLLHHPDSLSLANFDSVYLDINDSTRIRLFDTISADTRPYYKRIRRLWGLTHIDISGNKHIKTLAPLKKLTGLTSLDISNSLIDDLTPIRNLTELKSFDCSGTNISSLEPLHYSEKLIELNIENSAVSSLEVIKDLTLLEVLNCNHTAIDNLEPLAEISSLKELRCRHTLIDYLAPLENLINLKSVDLSNTKISSLEPLKNLININYLLIDHTNIKDVEALEQMTGLKYLYMDYTAVGDLDPLSGLPDLERIYCDNTNVDQAIALEFLKSKPEVLLVYESAELNSWWNELSNAWKEVFSNLILVDSIPSKEQLHQLTLIDRIDINGSTEIDSLDALATLINLAELDISN
ncbi:MAG: leucine-rich repeat domain-containing protein, partial [Bacteroidales bacterium]|nr:leucine-rich repeat domain-containing protein [Bacteroidales bacterium]